MHWTSIIAIYTLFWVLSAFLVMPFGLRTPDEVRGHVLGRGHANSAPVNFRPRVICARATVLGLVLFALFYANYVHAWITMQDLNVFGPTPVKNLGY